MSGPKSQPIKQNILDRIRIEQETKEFLERGGTITQLPKNASAWDEDAVEFIPRKKMRGRKREQDAPDFGL
jgi:hypothetical protein